MELNLVRPNAYKGVILAMAVGLISLSICYVFKYPVLDPLFVSMLIGIFLRSIFKFNTDFINGFRVSPLLFIPVGAIFYGAVNLNFREISMMPLDFVFSILIVMVSYIISILCLSYFLGLGEKNSYLITVGSAICGASAIAIASESIQAEPEETSQSLVAVFLSGIIGLFVVLALFQKSLSLSHLDFSVFSGCVLQFTGFVKEAVRNMGSEFKTLALSVKAFRYIGLLFLIPIFSSLAKGRIHIPWFLWAFLFSGILFSVWPQLFKSWSAYLKIGLNLLWSIAMASVGLNSDIKQLFASNGLKCFLVSLISFLIACAMFLLCLYIKSF